MIDPVSSSGGINHNSGVSQVQQRLAPVPQTNSSVTADGVFIVGKFDPTKETDTAHELAASSTAADASVKDKTKESVTTKEPVTVSLGDQGYQIGTQTIGDENSPQLRPTAPPPNSSVGIGIPSLVEKFDGTMESHSRITRLASVRHQGELFHDKQITDAIKKASGGGIEAESKALLAFRSQYLSSNKIIMRVARELNLRGASQEVLDFLAGQKKLAQELGTGTGFFESVEIKEMQAEQHFHLQDYKAAVGISDEILAKDPNNAEAWRTKSMALRDGASSPSDRANALNAFEEGFRRTGDYSLGIGAVHAELEKGNFAGAQKVAKLVSIAAKNVGADQTKKFWPVMAYAEAELLSGSNVNEQQAAVRRVEELFDAREDNGTPLVNQQQKQSALKRIREVSNASPEAQKALAPLVERLEMQLGEKSFQPLPANYGQRVSDTDTVFRERLYHSREAVLPGGMVVSGNVRFNSMLGDSCTTIEDKQQFREVAERSLKDFIKAGLINSSDLPEGVNPNQSLMQIENLELRVKASEAVARGIFNVDGRNLEYLHSIDHKIYDSVVRLRILHSGATALDHLTKEELTSYTALTGESNKELYWKVLNASRGKLNADQMGELDIQLEKSGILRGLPNEEGLNLSTLAVKLVQKSEPFRKSDTRTSSSICAEQTIGDCRHVAATAEGLVSAVQQEKTRQNLMKAMACYQAGDMDRCEQYMKAAEHEINSYEMRISDNYITGAVEVNELYDPVLTKDGEFVASADGKVNAIETHMNNLLRIEGPDGRVRYVVADAFYQKGPYPMAWVECGTPEVIPGKKLSGQAMDILRIQAGTIKAVVCQRDAAGNLIFKDGHPIPVLDELGKRKVITTALGLKSTEFASPERIRTPKFGGSLMLLGAAVESRSLVARLTDPNREKNYLLYASFVVKYAASGEIPSEIPSARLSEAQERVKTLV